MPLDQLIWNRLEPMSNMSLTTQEADDLDQLSSSLVAIASQEESEPEPEDLDK